MKHKTPEPSIQPTDPNERIYIPGTPFSLPKKALEKQVEDAKILELANRAPFPGETREAFSYTQDIKVGKYSIRPFYDGDIDILVTLNHPLAEMIFNEEENEWGSNFKTSRGQLAWDVCYLMTHPSDEIEKLIEEGEDGIKQLKTLSKKEFRNTPIGELLAIQIAIAKQFGRSFATVVGFEADDGEGSKKKPS